MVYLLMASKYLVVRKVYNNHVFLPTYSSTLSMRDYVYQMLFTPEGALPFRPSYGIVQDFTSVEQFQNNLSDKLGQYGASVEIYRDAGRNILSITLDRNIIAQISVEEP